MSESANRPKQTGKRKAPKSAFKPGESGNPSGRPALSQIEKDTKRMTRDQYASIQQVVMTKTKEELIEIVARGLPFEEELFILHVLELGEKPNMIAYDKYLDRRIGKVKEEIDVRGIRPTIIERRDGSEFILDVEEKEEG